MNEVLERIEVQDKARRFGFLWGLTIGLTLGLGSIFLTIDFCIRQAVRAGHAEYYLDKDNQRQWRWLPVEKTHD